MDIISERLTHLSPEKQALLRQMLQSNEKDTPEIPLQPRNPGQANLPLSYAQQSLWFLDQLVPDNPFYNMPSAVRLVGDLNILALERAFNEILRRHEALRTTFPTVNGKPEQKVSPEMRLEIPVKDIRDVPDADREKKAEQMATANSLQPFDLAQGPLIRVVLYKLHEQEYLLLFTLHHIISDGWSIGVLIQELGLLYEAFSKGERSPFPEPPVQYADYALWQREWLEKGLLENQLSYWQKKLRGVSLLRVPTDHPRPPIQTFQGETQYVELPAQWVRTLEQFCQDQGATLFMALLAVFKLLLFRYSGQKDIVVGTPVANRKHREVEGLIGFFANSLVLATDISDDPSFSQLLARVKNVTLEAYAHQDSPFEMLVEKLEIERDPSRNPLFQVMFSLQTLSVNELALSGLRVKSQKLHNDTTHFDMEFHLWHGEGSVKGYVSYNKALFERTTIIRMLSHFLLALETVLADPEQKVSTLPLVSNGERNWLLERNASAISKDSMKSEQVYDLRFTPSGLAAFLESSGEAEISKLSPQSNVLCSGGLLHREIADAFFRKTRCGLTYLYKPPEAGCDVSFHTCQPGGEQEIIPAGNTFQLPVYVLDSHQQLAPIGVPGDIYVGKQELPNLKDGDDALIPDPFSEGGYLVRTGDRGRWLSDGTLELLDIPSRRVWTEGMRFDLSDVEAAVTQYPGIEDCHVSARLANGIRELVAYVVALGTPDSSQIQKHLESLLPPAMIPKACVRVSRLPMTPDGVLDERALSGLEVIDSDLIQRWETRLRSVPEIEQVRVLPRTWEPPAPLLHISDLLPDWQTESPTAPPTSHSSLVTSHSSLVTSHSSLVTSHSSLPFSHSSGGPLHIPEDAPKTLAEALIRSARECGAQGIHYIQAEGDEGFLSYSDLLDAAMCILTGLQAKGLRPGSRVILQVENLADHFSTFWACVLGGIVPVTVAIPNSHEHRDSVVNKLWNTWKLLEYPTVLTNTHLEESLSHVPELYPEDSELAGHFRVMSVEPLMENPPSENPHPCQPRDVVFFQLTSGSTGVPKCIQETHWGIIHHIHGSQQFNDYTPENVTLNWLPMDHVVPILTCHLKDTYLGIRQIHVRPNVILANPLKWLDLIEAHKVTHTWAPNFGFKLVSDGLSKEPDRTWDLSSIKFFMNAGEQVTLPVVADFLERLAPFGVSPRAMQPAFGMAEVCTCMTYQNQFGVNTGIRSVLKSSLGDVLQDAGDDKNAITFVDLGPPMPGIEIRIADADNKTLPESMIGRFQIRGETTTPGYLYNDAANQEAFVGDGWFNSGDIGFIRDGRLFLTGREKETIIIRGANFYCYEIEDVVNSIPGVEPTFSAACAVDDPETGTEGLAIFFVPQETPPCAPLKGGFSGSEVDLGLLRIIKETVARDLGISPTHVIPLDKPDFPKTTSGKIQRTQLKKGLLAGEFQEVVKKIELVLESDNTLPEWFYKPTWERKEAVVSHRNEGNPPVLALRRRPEYPGSSDMSPLRQGNHGGIAPTIFPLVFWDGLGLGDAFCKKTEMDEHVKVEIGSEFSKITSNHYCINPKESGHYHELLSSLSADGIQIHQILHLWTYDEYRGKITSMEQLESAQDIGVYSLLLLTQALAQANKDSQPIRMLAVSSHSQALSSEEKIAFEKTPMQGLLKTIPLEMPWLDCRHLDLPPHENEANAERIIRESRAVSKDREVAYRNGHRMIPVLEKAAFLEKQDLPFVRNGVYLISGGLGGIGVEIAKYLLTHYAARLILVGRTPLPEISHDAQLETDTPDAEKIAARVHAFKELEPFDGEVIYEAADICDPDQMREVCREAENRWESGLDGVIHLAGIFQTRLLNEETPGSFSESLRPKILGAWVLHQLLGENGLFISFGSVNGFLGGLTAGAYSAANAFPDAFSHYLQHKRSLRSHCFSWSMWDEVGMSRGYLMREQSRDQGYFMIDPRKGIAALLAGLHADHPRLLIGLDAAKPFVRPRVKADAYLPQQLCAYLTASEGAFSSETLQMTEMRDRFGTLSRCEFVRISEMPLTASGEIDTVRLSDMARQSAQASGEKIAPRTGLERTLAGIWQEVLGTDTVGVHNSFFELGGQSVLLVQVHSKVQQALGQDLSMVELLRYPTISSLANYLGQKEKQKPSYQGAQERADKQKQIRQKRMQQKRGRGRPRFRN